MAAAASVDASEGRQLSEKEQQAYEKIKPAVLALWPAPATHQPAEERSGKWKRFVFRNAANKETLPLIGGRVTFSFDLNKVKQTSDSEAPDQADTSTRRQVFNMRFLLARHRDNGAAAAAYDAAIEQLQQLTDLLAADYPCQAALATLPLFKPNGDARGIYLTLPNDANCLMARAEDKRIDPNVSIKIDGRQQHNLTRGQLMRLVLGKEYAVKCLVRVVALVSDVKMIIMLYITMLDLTRMVHSDRQSEVVKADSEAAANMDLF
jgi:hypothetical protein